MLERRAHIASPKSGAERIKLPKPGQEERGLTPATCREFHGAMHFFRDRSTAIQGCGTLPFMHHSLSLWLVHPREEMCQAFRERFTTLPQVEVLQERFENLPPHDCFVTAGNAFGIMNAGIDAAVTAYFGPQIMARVQHRIMDEYLGEQPAGTAFLLETGDQRVRYLCHAPTMRVPGCIEGTDKIYAATWASLLAVYQHNVTAAEKIQTVAFPAFGTGFGGVPASEAARQMAVAYQHYLHPPHRLDWDWVADRQRAICYDQGRPVVRG